MNSKEKLKLKLGRIKIPENNGDFLLLDLTQNYLQSISGGANNKCNNTTCNATHNIECYIGKNTDCKNDRCGSDWTFINSGCKNNGC